MNIKRTGCFGTIAVAVAILSCFSGGCGTDTSQTSDQVQQQQQEQLNQEATRQTGMPAVTNFTMRKDLKTIIEDCDKTGYSTYTYVENLTPTIHHGNGPGATVLGGKFTYVGVSMGYGIPYSTQYTNPSQTQVAGKNETTVANAIVVMPQADPDGLYKPGSASGTWIMMLDPTGATKDVHPVYMEPNVFVSPFKYPFD